MKLLFDQNLSFKLCQSLADIYPGSLQVRSVGLSESLDSEIRVFAKANGFILVTQDADFAEIATLRGSPPKIIWLRCGNKPTRFIAGLPRNHYESVSSFCLDDQAVCLQIY